MLCLRDTKQLLLWAVSHPTPPTPPHTSHHTTHTSTPSDVFVVVVDPVPVPPFLSFTPFAEFFVYDNGVNPSDAKKGGEIRKELACCTYVRVASPRAIACLPV